MNSAPKIEIFILTWNRVNLLREALSSALAQTLHPGRIVVVDNASDDETASYVSSVMAENPNVTLIRQPTHVDVCLNMLTAIANVKSEYFLLMHDDDRLDSGFVAWTNAILGREDDVSAVCSAQRPFFGQDACEDVQLTRLEYDVYSSKTDFVAAEFVRRQQDTACFPAILYRKDRVRTNTLRDNVFGKIVDKPFFYSCIDSGKIVRLCTPLYKYRIHPNQDSQTSANGPFPDEILNLLRVQREVLSDDELYARVHSKLSIRLMKSLYKWGGNPWSGWRAFVKKARELRLTSSIVPRPWRIPFWSTYSNLLRKKVLRKAEGAAKKCFIDKEEVSS